jgi:hypothetical protein
LPSAADDEDAPLADRLSVLREVSLLVRVRSGVESTILRLRPDRLWLLGGLHVAGDRCVHRSTWHLQATPRPFAPPAANDSLRIASTLRLQEEDYRRSSHPVWIDGNLLVRLALTPVALALDVVLGPGAGDFLQLLAGNGPKPNNSQGRGKSR